MSTFEPQALSDFARYYGFHYDRIDPFNLVEDVLIDMDRGLKGQPSSLVMIPAYLSPVFRAPAGKTVIALDAGGTNLRAALVKFDETGRAVEGESRKAPMPGTQGRLGAEAFFDAIADAALPLFEKAQVPIEGIGFCFSYPTEITKDADGILLKFSKEVDAPQVIGKRIGAGLRDALLRKGVKVPERVALLNDTAATLLCGLGQIAPSGGLLKGEDRYGAPPGPMVGLILGTGFNTAYPETCIPKTGFYSEKSPQIVVCEAGNFTHRYRGYLDMEYDATTKNPGAYTLEKCVSGAYLGPLSFHILKQAVKDGLLKFRRQDEFMSWQTMQTRHLNEFMHSPLSMEGPVAALFDKDEIDALRGFCYLTSIVTGRGALLAAAMTAAAVEKSGSAYDPFAPARIAVEGTTYVIYKGMRTALESWLHILLNQKKPRSYVITPVEQASLLGAAVAALSE
ncbi:MAG: hexokinase [Treponema sp.]|jgi:hexokinase|nr:hexokinase [Treponema sp.]